MGRLERSLLRFALGFVLCARLETRAHAEEADAGPAAPAGEPSAASNPSTEPEPGEAPNPAEDEQESGAPNFGSTFGGAPTRDTTGGRTTNPLPAEPNDEAGASAPPSIEGAPSLPSGLYFPAYRSGKTSWMLTVAPAFGIQTGTETYEFHADLPNTLGLDVNVSSKLSYPVAGALAGGTVLGGVGPVGFSATVLTNLGDPWGTLLDQDFVSASDGTQSETVEISHTDSDTTLRMIDAEGAVRLRIGTPAPGKATALHVVAGFRYESNVYDAYGASGWQLDQDANKVYSSIPGSPHALHYEVRYRQPFLGMGLNVGGAGDSFLFSGEARFIASWSSHEDDHVLRNKLAQASAFGGGIGVKLEPAFALLGAGRFRLLGGLSAQLQVVGSFSGTLKQHYYGDDPTIPDDQSNQPIPDSSFSFLSVRARLLAFLAARF